MSNFVVWFSNPEIRHTLKAAEIGCAYWAWTKSPLSAAYDEELDVFDRNDGTHLGKLDFDSLNKAPGKVVDACKKGLFRDDSVLGGIVRGGDRIDPRTADVIVQFALFGEQKYEQ